MRTKGNLMPKGHANEPGFSNSHGDRPPANGCSRPGMDDPVFVNLPTVRSTLVEQGRNNLCRTRNVTVSACRVSRLSGLPERLILTHIFLAQ
jgi:hypothetical protein